MRHQYPLREPEMRVLGKVFRAVHHSLNPFDPLSAWKIEEYMHLSNNCLAHGSPDLLLSYLPPNITTCHHLKVYGCKNLAQLQMQVISIFPSPLYQCHKHSHLFWWSLSEAFCNKFISFDKSNKDTLGKPPETAVWGGRRTKWKRKKPPGMLNPRCILRLPIPQPSITIEAFNLQQSNI